MSYNDDDELKMGDFTEEEEDDLDLDSGVEEPLEDDITPEDDDELAEGFAGLDGSAEY